ncbi:MAG: lysylphosphatidylglycerol synthase domain-containing protein [Nostocaceae cyanobacterium]|nr:lysylphosphatidylglycerol synthase domain-containing protein [Nostocaceae cyanobacterium]
MLTKIRPHLSSLLGLLLLALSVWVISRELREYNYRDVLNSLGIIPKSRLSWAIWLTALSYLVMVGYDVIALNYVGRPLSFNKVAFTSFISCTFSNTIGFALLTGSAIRYRFYSAWGVSTWAIAQVIAFANFTFWLGMFAVAGMIFLVNPVPIPSQLKLPPLSVRPIGLVFLLLVSTYLLGSIISRQPWRIRDYEFRFPNFPVALAQITVSSLDWILAAAVFYPLLPSNTPLSYLDFLGIYLLAMFAGVISNVPGGLGVFETVILLILSQEVSAAAILAALLLYRGIYYFLPLVIATALLGFYELRVRYWGNH